MRNLALRNLHGAVVFAWVATFLLMRFGFSTWSDRGQFGDMFGALNVLFSGFAFAALYYTISLQQSQLQRQEQQLQLQREELKLQREEMAASREELARQADAQASLTRATIAQIRVAAINARVEAEKLWIDTPRRQEAVKSIERASRDLEELAKNTERRN